MPHQVLNPPMPLLIHLLYLSVSQHFFCSLSAPRSSWAQSSALAQIVLCCGWVSLPPLLRHGGAYGLIPNNHILHAIFWVSWCKGKITKADTLTIWLDVTPFRLIGVPTSIIATILKSDALPAEPSQFILAWDRHQVCWLACPVAWLPNVQQ